VKQHQQQQEHLSPLDTFLYSNKKGKGTTSHPEAAAVAVMPGILNGPQQQQQHLEERLREKQLRKQFMSSKVMKRPC
jgi:hypothetical protein